MKKHNEGYALPFVLVVMIVMCLVTTGLLDGSLRNLKSQKAMISRMQDQYAAQGAIEQVIGQLGQENTVAGPTAEGISAMITSLCESASGNTAVGELTINAVVDSSDVTISEKLESGSHSVENYAFELKSTVNATQVTCKIELKGTITVATEEGGNTVYSMTTTELAYKSYSQSTGGTT